MIVGPHRYERFAGTRVQAARFFAVRVDGHHFHELTRRMRKPYDGRFRSWINEALKTYLLQRHCSPFFAFVFSDEISLVFRKDDDLYGRRVEKLVSLIAAGLSAVLTRTIGSIAWFDARVAVLPRFEDLIRYLAERQAEARRDCINAYTFYTLIRAGFTHEQAGETMCGWRFNRMNRFLRERKIMFGRLPLWQRRGEAWYWESYTKPGRNPLTGARALATRSKLVRNVALPHFTSNAGRRLVRKALRGRDQG